MMLLLLLCCALASVHASDFPPPKEPFTLSWTGAPMVWPNEAARDLYKSAGNFDPSHMVGTRFALFRDQVFMVFPRYREGACATLAKSSLLVPSGEPSWEPFPSWQAQTENDSNGLQNVIDVVLEQSPKNTLWVLDNGIVDTLTAPKLKCAPKIVGFDPTNGKRLHTIELKEFILPHSRLQYLAVDTDSTGQITLFVSDAGANAVIVYNLDKDSGYRAVLPEVISDGCKASGDILYIATIKNKPGVNKLYLTYHCGNGIYSLNVADLRAGTTEGTLEVVSQNKPEKMIIIGTATSAGVLYFRYDKDPNVYSWCVDEELTKENVKEIHHGESSLLATHAVLDPLRNRVRILLSNFLDFLKGSVGVGAVQVLRAVS